uniref:Uncharacterized protein n=1 Tax=Octopus bimaculoides TaxID=37653 RepID=A0A0L8GXZ9_OCTBM
MPFFLEPLKYVIQNTIRRHKDLKLHLSSSYSSQLFPLSPYIPYLFLFTIKNLLSFHRILRAG